MTSIRTVVADAETPARTRLLQLLQRENDIAVVGTASDGEAALDLVRRLTPDLVFLDAQLPQLDGFAVLRQLAPGELPIAVMVSGHDRFAIEAFEAHAFDFLLKPFSVQRFQHALTRARTLFGSPERRALIASLFAATDAPRRVDRQPGYLEHLALKANGCTTFLDVDDVDWVEAAGVYIYVHVGARQHLYRSSVTRLLQRLDPHRFVRIHRSAAVNTSRIRELRSRSHGDFALTLKDGTELTLSRSYRSMLEGWLRQPL